jgi:hypothetical protein
MKTQIRFERLALLGCVAVVIFGSIGYYINEHLHMAGPPYFVAAFALAYGIFYTITKKAMHGKIKWLVRD